MDVADLVAELIHGHLGTTPYLLAGTEDSLSHRELRANVTAAAETLAAAGIRAGSTVALQLPPSFTQIEQLLAIWSLDAQVQLLDHRLKPAELAALFRICHPQYFVHAGSRSFRARHMLVTETMSGGLPAPTAHRLVQFSSGSTGTPKVIGRTAASIHDEIARFGAVAGMPGLGERVLLLSSTSYSFGLIAGFLHSLAVGAEIVFASKLSAADLARTAADQAVEVILGVPFHFDLMSSIRQAPELPALRAAVSGGELMPQETATRFAATYGVDVGEAYGTTETGVIAMEVFGTRRPAVGPPAPGMQVRIADGQLEVRLDESPYLVANAENNYERGWFRTRDRAELGVDGSVRLFGRSDSLVVIGGLKVDLREVELALARHPRVNEVVVRYDGRIEAYLGATDPLPEASELIGWCREQLADHKIPKVLHILPALPRTSSGKLVRSRSELRAASH